jgi:hypothetical protein
MPPYFDTRTHPVGVTACAQAPLTLCAFGEDLMRDRTVDWLIRELRRGTDLSSTRSEGTTESDFVYALCAAGASSHSHASGTSDEMPPRAGRRASLHRPRHSLHRLSSAAAVHQAAQCKHELACRSAGQHGGGCGVDQNSEASLAEQPAKAGERRRTVEVNDVFGE